METPSVISLYDSLRTNWKSLIRDFPAEAEYVFTLMTLGYSWDSILVYYILRHNGVKSAKRKYKLFGEVGYRPADIDTSKAYRRYLLTLRDGREVEVRVCDLLGRRFKSLKKALSNVPDEGVRLERPLGKFRARYAENLLDMPLKVWMECTSLAVSYDATKDNAHLRKLALCLYEYERKGTPDPFNVDIITTCAVWWWLSANREMAHRFPLVFASPKKQPAADEEEEPDPELKNYPSQGRMINEHIEMLNMLLYDLTDGDILKEEAVAEQTVERCFVKLQLERKNGNRIAGSGHPQNPS